VSKDKMGRRINRELNNDRGGREREAGPLRRTAESGSDMACGAGVVVEEEERFETSFHRFSSLGHEFDFVIDACEPLSSSE
jgi:hypothetical protein